MGIPEDHPAIRAAVRRGLVAPAAGPDPSAPPGRPELVAAAFDPAGPAWVLPLETRSTANLRDWRARSRLAQAARRAVGRAFGPALPHLAGFATRLHAAGRPVACTLTRLGGRRLDPGNVAAALKPVEDAVCYFLGLDDGDPRWRPAFAQEPGGPLGVRVELRGAAA